jgi:murein DD-endopeptidase MepM/ murein hydrolase activator NlpD
MSLRYSHPESRTPHRFCLTFAYGKGERSISIRPLLFYIIAGVLPVLGLWYLFATVYLIFRDDMLASLMNHQTEMQYSYEDRVTALHTQIDQLTSRRLLDEAALSSKMDDLAARQVRIEHRSAVVTSLAERVLPRPDAKNTASLATAQPADARAKAGVTARMMPNPLLTGAFSASLPREVSAFAPMQSNLQDAVLSPQTPPPKPRPDGFDLRHGEDSDLVPPALSDKASDAGDGSAALAHLNAKLDLIERDQDHLVARLQTPLMGEMARFRTVLAEAGLSADRLALRDSFSIEEHKRHDTGPKSAGSQSAVGGPFVPMKLDSDGSAFEREAVSLQEAILAVEHLRRAISSVPLRKPLLGDPDITSGFGGRMDPFFGRPAMHTGIDLREDYGTDVHATASGKVTIAAAEGGYGNMVEIDHGNGLSTRYAHMASISVSEGQLVEAGQVVGHIGMTGRTTGPHLHYETRIDGEPVDPLRFLKAGTRLFSDTSITSQQQD